MDARSGHEIMRIIRNKKGFKDQGRSKGKAVMDGEDRKEYFAHFRQFDKDGHENDLFNTVAFFTYFDHNYESSGANFRCRPLTGNDPKGQGWKSLFGSTKENRTRTY